MKTRISPTLVGLFVIGALLLAVAALLAFGGVNFFSKPQRFSVYFDESAHGLDIGSPVKLRGVRVGRVVDMAVLYDSTTNNSLVRVICEFSRNVIVDPKGDTFDVTDRKRLESMVEKGLRAQLGVQGLATGMLYVELDFSDPHEYMSNAGPVVGDAGKYLVVPSLTSKIAALQANVTQLLAEVRAMELPEIAKDFHGLINDTRKQVSGLKLAEMNDEFLRAGKAVASLAESAEVRQMFVDLNSAIAEMRHTLAKLDKGMDPAGEKLTKVLDEAQTALETFTQAAASARRFVDSQSGLGEETSRMLRQISETAVAIERLADYLERNPNALISGRTRGQGQSSGK